MARLTTPDDWIDDFGYVLTRDAFRIERGRYQYDVFAGSKSVAVLWLAVVASVGGALGGTLVSGALWDDLLNLPIWLAATAALGIALRWVTLALSGTPLAFLETWCFWWGLLIGACAIGAAQVSNGLLVYTIAAVVGFLIGIVQGVYEPEDLESHDAFFGASLLSAPLGACAAAWLYRDVLDSGSLAAAAIAGAMAGLLFLAPPMTVLLAKLNNVAGLTRLASLLLHRDETATEAIPVLDAAIRLAPDDPSLWDLRGLAHALAENEEAAEKDWVRHLALEPKSGAPDRSRGWAHLRHHRLTEAATALEAAAARSKRDDGALVGLGLARLRAGDAAGAIEALDHRVPAGRRGALGLTHLAEAHLAAGESQVAVRLASEAIDELDSIHARTWLVRGEARQALGDDEGAARDFNKAWWIEGEEGIQGRALAGLDAIGHLLEDDEPE